MVTQSISAGRTHLDLRERNRGLQDARWNRAREDFIEEEGEMRCHQDKYQIGDIEEDLVRREEMARRPAGDGGASAGLGRGTCIQMVRWTLMTYSCMWSTASISIQSAPIILACAKKGTAQEYSDQQEVQRCGDRTHRRRGSPRKASRNRAADRGRSSLLPTS